MSPELIVYVGSFLVILWGIAHILPTHSVVKGFGELSEDSRRILTMEWVAEGLALCFVGGLPLLLVTAGGLQDSSGALAIRACAVMLAILAVWTFLIGGKTKITPIKICPLVLISGAALFYVATLV